MACRVSLTNVAKGVVPTIKINTGPEVASDADSGYSRSALSDNVVARAFRCKDTATLFHAYFDMGSPQSISFGAVFDAGGAVSGPSKITSVDFLSSTDAINYFLRGSAIVNARGDGGVILPSGAVLAQYWKVTFNTLGGEKLDCGLIWLGKHRVLVKTYAQFQANPKRRTVVNETDGGGFFATKLSDYRHELNLAWPDTLSSAHQDLMTIANAADGALNSFVLMPRGQANTVDTDADGDPAILHGRITDSFPYERTGHPHFRGHVLQFTESGRAASA